MATSNHGHGILRHRRGQRYRPEDQQNLENVRREETQRRYNSVNASCTRWKLEPSTYWLTRIVFLRGLGLIYCTAFLVALNQNKQLVGRKGLLPANLYLNSIRKKHGDPTITWDLLSFVPSILWFVDYENHLDFWLDVIAYLGLFFSGFILIFGCANIVMMLTLWVLYHSLVNVGQRWYGFGWESQLLETGFLAAFLCPLWKIQKIPKDTPPPKVVIWGFRWLIFRIMLGAGLIKIRGDQCWRDLTCMNYHYETQPVPNPLSYYMHQEPVMFHKFETSVNHFVELVAPFLLILPRNFCVAGGVIQILFQVILILSGNLSFLNWLTILPSICCLDDKFLGMFFSNSDYGVKHQVWGIQQDLRVIKKTLGQYVRRVFDMSLALTLAYLSIPVVQNLLSSQQYMNTSFEPLRIVNTYGAFGSITKERTEVIFLGTQSADPEDPKAKWLEYEFNCKPGPVKRRPCIISPYHYRLDWLMWFAAFQSYNHNPWLIHLAAKFLQNDDRITSLIAHNPFENQDPPNGDKTVVPSFA